MNVTSMHKAYRDLLMVLQENGYEEVNSRTKTRILMVTGGCSFKLDLSNGRLPMPGNRAYFPHVAAAETAWQFMGTQDASFILKKAPKLWSKFERDGKIETAYGYRWREHFGRDQLELAMEELENNPTNRQLVVCAWDPANDGLGGPQPPNIPCPAFFSLTRDQRHLHLSLFIRSSDVFVGLPYDVMCYGLTLDAIAASVGLSPGYLHVTLAHAHVYEPHFKMMADCIRGDHDHWPQDVEPMLPAWTVDMVRVNPDQYVDHVKRLAGRVNRNPWNPMPEVVA